MLTRSFTVTEVQCSAGVGALALSRSQPTVALRVRLRASVFRQFVVAELEGIADMDAALALKNTIVYARRSDIPLDEGEYFIADLIGLPVRDASTGKLYGTLKETINRGASDIYVVDTPDGDRMIPAVPEFIRSIDPDTEILVSPIEGMLD